MPVRTIAIPVAEVVEGGTKREFYEHLRKSLQKAVVIANQCVVQCLKQDDFSTEKGLKIYTYPAFKSDAVGWSKQLSGLVRAVEQSYLRKRRRIACGLEKQITFRSQPLPLLASESNTAAKDGVWFCSMNIMGKKFVVRLAGGSNFSYQLRGLAKADKIGDSKIWMDKKGKAIIGLACEIAFEKVKGLSGEAFVQSSRDSLLVMSFPRCPVPYVINEDRCCEIQAKTNKQYQRLRQDRKSGMDRRRIAEAMNAIADRRKKQMNAIIHDVSSAVVKQCVRRKIAKINIDLTVKSFLPRFPWFDLVTKITYKAEQFGIVVVDGTQLVAEPSLDGPHVYFAYDRHAHRVKIGQTIGGDSRFGNYLSWSPDAIILAIDNQPKAKLRAKETKHHAYFAAHRVIDDLQQVGKKKDMRGKEVFYADPVIEWLRAVGWLGNAGNLSQIMQVLDVSNDTSSVGHLWAYGDSALAANADDLSQNAESSEDIAEQSTTALAVGQLEFSY